MGDPADPTDLLADALTATRLVRLRIGRLQEGLPEDLEILSLRLR